MTIGAGMDRPWAKCASCRRATPPHQLMCQRCWDIVPRELQTALYAQYERGRVTQSHRWRRLALAAVGAVCRQLDLFPGSAQ